MYICFDKIGLCAQNIDNILASVISTVKMVHVIIWTEMFSLPSCNFCCMWKNKWVFSSKVYCLNYDSKSWSDDLCDCVYKVRRSSTQFSNPNCFAKVETPMIGLEHVRTNACWKTNISKCCTTSTNWLWKCPPPWRWAHMLFWIIYQ